MWWYFNTRAEQLFIFSVSCDNFLFDSFGLGVSIRQNPRDGIFRKRPKLYVSSFKLVGVSRSTKKISFNIRGGISIQRPKIPFISVPDEFLTLLNLE